MKMPAPLQWDGPHTKGNRMHTHTNIRLAQSTLAELAAAVLGITAVCDPDEAKRRAEIAAASLGRLSYLLEQIAHPAMGPHAESGITRSIADIIAGNTPEQVAP